MHPPVQNRHLASRLYEKFPHLSPGSCIRYSDTTGPSSSSALLATADRGEEGDYINEYYIYLVNDNNSRLSHADSSAWIIDPGSMSHMT